MGTEQGKTRPRQDLNLAEQTLAPTALFPLSREQVDYLDISRLAKALLMQLWCQKHMESVSGARLQSPLVACFIRCLVFLESATFSYCHCNLTFTFTDPCTTHAGAPYVAWLTQNTGTVASVCLCRGTWGNTSPRGPARAGWSEGSVFFLGTLFLNQCTVLLSRGFDESLPLKDWSSCPTAEEPVLFHLSDVVGNHYSLTHGAHSTHTVFLPKLHSLDLCLPALRQGFSLSCKPTVSEVSGLTLY